MKMIRVERKRTSIKSRSVSKFSLLQWYLLLIFMIICLLSLLPLSTFYLISCIFMLFPCLVPLCNFSMSLLTTFPNWASFTPSLSSPMSRAYNPMPPAPTFMILLPIIISSTRTSPTMRTLFMTTCL